MAVQQEVARRPLKTRSSAAAQGIARWLSQQTISPNQISLLSVVFALTAAVSLALRPYLPVVVHPYLLVAAALFIQLRLLCNLLDGMVAVEGGKRTKSGELFNEMPDRVADALILVAAGYSLGGLFFGAALGWLAALLAVMTAYARALAVSTGLPQDFRGPMAKPHRMAAMTGACLLSLFEPLMGLQTGTVIAVGLWIIILGSALTLWRRTATAYRVLEGRR